MKTAAQSALKAGQRQWTCSHCSRRFAARGIESAEQFAERCGAHRSGKHCQASTLAIQLSQDGLERLIGPDGDFTGAHGSLKYAGLVQMHRTRLVEPDSASAEPWAPQWAIAYEQYLREHQRLFSERVTELRQAAESPETVARARAFLALVATDR